MNARLGGKIGRCKKCGHRMTIPAAPPPAASVAASGMFRLGAVAPAEPPPSSPAESPQASEGAPNSPASSFLGLAPITEDFVKPVVPAKPEPVEESSSSLYDFAPSVKVPSPFGQEQRFKPARRPTTFYGTLIGRVLYILRKSNDFAYLISVPFMLLLLLGIVLKQQHLAILGVTWVIVLNIGRLAVNGFYLVILAFRNGPVEGALFFIPPLTFYYLARHWETMKPATLRFLGPAVLIVGAVLVFVCVPWFTGGDAGEDLLIGEQIKDGIGAWAEEIQDKVEGRGTLGDNVPDDAAGPVRPDVPIVEKPGEERPDGPRKQSSDDPTTPRPHDDRG